MIRSLDTVGHQFNLLQKKQENLSTNIANVNTSGYKYQELVQSTTETFQFGNNLNGPMLNQQNPAAVGRALDYYGYFNQARLDAIKKIRATQANGA